MKTILFFLLFFNFSFSFTIATASNMIYVMPKLISEFKKEYKIDNIKVVYSSSGKLTSQIQRGAPFDIFISANIKYPNYLYKKGFLYTKPSIFAKGGIGLFCKKRVNSLQDINNLTIAVANPKNAPFGVASIEVIKSLKLTPKIVYAETISQALFYGLKATDCAFISTSSIYSPKMKKFLKNVLEIDINLYKPIPQTISIVRKNLDAFKFYVFMFSKKAQHILKQYGYITN